MISIIIPVFNTEDRLSVCVKSVLNQTFSDFELILINDGSTDQSLSVCKSFAELDARILVINQNNAGASAARNRGLDVAKGKYITFIDSDDFVDPHYLESFFKGGFAFDKTIVQQGYVREDRSGTQKTFKYPFNIYKGSNFSDLFLSSKLLRKAPFSMGKLYDSDIIKTNHLRFEEGIKYGEDLIFLLDCLQYAEFFIMISDCGYHYRYSEGSLTYTVNPYESEINRLQLVINKLEILNKKFNLDKEAIGFNNSYLVNYLLRAFRSLYVKNPLMRYKDRIGILKKNAKLDFHYIIVNNYIPLRRLDRVFKLLYSKHLYIMLDLFFYIRFRLLKLS